jgi:hypothetical protein
MAPVAIYGGIRLALALVRANKTEPQRDTLPSPALDTSLPELDLTELATELEDSSEVRFNPKC